MLEIYGRMIPETLEELIDPGHTAVVVVDAQNDFCKDNGAAYRSGGDLSDYPETLNNLRKLIKAARNAGALVVYLQNTAPHNNTYYSASQIRDRIRLWVNGSVEDFMEKIPSVCLEGTWGEQIVDELKPSDKDVIVKKFRASGFIQTNLDLVLRNHNIKTLVITGFVSNGCVFATARVGVDKDYFIVVAKDCMNSPRKEMHEVAMKMMENRFDAHTSNEIIDIWKK